MNFTNFMLKNLVRRLKRNLKTDAIKIQIDFINDVVIINDKISDNVDLLKNKDLIRDLVLDKHGVKDLHAIMIFSDDNSKVFEANIFYEENGNKLKKEL